MPTITNVQVPCKITYVLQRDYGIHISVGRQLPRMSTKKPYHNNIHKDNGDCTNHLHQDFNQKSLNLVWVSDFTYIKASGKWYYLCIVMDLFSRKVISWNISGKSITLCKRYSYLFLSILKDSTMPSDHMILSEC